MAKIAVGSVVEAYFVKLGAMPLRHRSKNGITTSALFGRGRRGGKSDGGSRANAAHVTTFAAGKEFEATTDGVKNTDVHVFVYDSSGAEVAKDDSSGPKGSGKLTPTCGGQER